MSPFAPAGHYFGEFFRHNWLFLLKLYLESYYVDGSLSVR